MYAKAFESLTVPDKTLSYFSSQSIICPIVAIMQRHAEGLVRWIRLDII